MDQASTLRQMVQGQRKPEPRQRSAPSHMRVIAVTSGKGGVGKTNTVLNLALALSERNRKVLLLDADMGLANVDVLLGLTPRYTLEHVLDGRKDIMEVVLEGPRGLKILPSGSGIGELSELSFDEQRRLFAGMRRIDEEVDYLFIDTGAGISSNVLRFNASANEVVVVANPEPTSITDAYALMKLLAIKYHIRDFGLIANAVSSEQDGHAVFDRLNRVCGQFLRVNLSYLGSVPFDQSVRKAVRQQRPLLDLYPNAPSSRGLQRIAALIDQNGKRRAPPPAPTDGAAQSASFWDRLLHWRKA